MKKYIVMAVTIFAMAVFAGCGEKPSETKTEVSVFTEPVFEVAAPGEYDSADTAVIAAISELNKTISFYNYELGKSYTLSYDSLTKFSDKYGCAVSVGQLTKGKLVNLRFLKSGKLLTNLEESTNGFFLNDISGFSIDLSKKVFGYKDDSYKISDSTIIISGNKYLTYEDISPADRISISGEDTTIYCISVDKGHGYLSLTGADYFLDGYIEIGQGRIEKISGDMKWEVPEGSYDIRVSRNETETVRKVEVTKNSEITLDLSDVEIEEIKTGKVLFGVTPEETVLYIDGMLVDHTNLLVLDYGTHSLAASATGYQPVTKYFRVGQEMATLSLALEPVSDKSEAKEESHTDGAFIFVSAPSGVELFFDGYYKGLTPASIPKVSGSHTITLRKAGFVSRDYAIQVENTDKDEYFSFDNLVEEKNVTYPSYNSDDVSKNEAVSGN